MTTQTDDVLESLEHAVAAVRARTDLVPRVGVVLGSGLGALADTLADATPIPYGDIPGMPRSHVAGHAGRLVLGRLEGVECVVMSGRVHLYEGHTPTQVVMGARLMARLGARAVVITNAAGGLDRSFEPGDLMLVTDHMNLTGRNPLAGPNFDALGPRFPDMTNVYDAELCELARDVSASLGQLLREGVYVQLLGPSYETPAEVRMLAQIGGHAVGMSTAIEAIALRHMGVRVLSISCITNRAAGLSAGPLNHAEVEETASRIRHRFVPLVCSIVRSIGEAW